VIEFGEFQFEPGTPLLTRNSRSVDIAPKALEILGVLVRNAGHVVGKEELLSLVWPNEVVEESNLAVHISALRKVLVQNGARTEYIETIPKRGYRFAQAVTRQPSVVVLPFQMLGSDGGDEHLGEALADEIINALSRIPGLTVIARTSSFSFKRRQDDLRGIAAALQVSHIVRGTVESKGGSLRITVQLIGTAEATQDWSQRFDRQKIEILRIPEEVAEAIASCLQLRLLGTSRKTESVDAYNCYLKAMFYYMRLTSPDKIRGKEYFEQAVRCDPAFAQAYAGLALCYYNIPPAVLGLRPAEARSQARSLLEKALSLDPLLPEAHCILGMAATFVDYNWSAAEREFRIAMAAEPVSSTIRYTYAHWLLLPLRRFDAAIDQWKRGLETDPLSGLLHFGLSLTLYLAGDPDAALAHAATALEISSDFWLIRFVIGIAQLQKGSIEQAISSLERALAVGDGYAPAVGTLAACYVLSGRTQEADRLMQSRPATPRARAYYHAILGEPDQMFESFEPAITEREYLIPLDVNCHAMAPYRADPRFRELLRRMNLDPIL
jgi:TolB-like protein